MKTNTRDEHSSALLQRGCRQPRLKEAAAHSRVDVANTAASERGGHP